MLCSDYESHYLCPGPCYFISSNHFPTGSGLPLCQSCICVICLGPLRRILNICSPQNSQNFTMLLFRAVRLENWEAGFDNTTSLLRHVHMRVHQVGTTVNPPTPFSPVPKCTVADQPPRGFSSKKQQLLSLFIRQHNPISSIFRRQIRAAQLAARRPQSSLHR